MTTIDRPARRRVTAHDRVPLGINLTTGVVALVGADFAAALLPAVDGTARLLVVVAVVAVFALVTVDVAAVAALTLIAFLLFDGFLVNQLGELSWHGAADGGRLLVLCLAGAAGLLAGHGRRRLDSRRRLAEVEAWANGAHRPR